MAPLYKKEITYYLNNPIGYIVITLFAVLTNFFFIKDIILVGSASTRPLFGLIPWLFLVFIPALSMRSLAEEKRANTIETLLTLPVSELQVVLAKFLALVTLVAIGLALTLALPVALWVYSGLYLPELLTGYVGALFLAGLYIALSMFFSSQTKNQVVAFLFSVVVLFVLLIMATDAASTVLPKFVQDALSYFSPQYHMENFVKGLIDMRSVVYFLSGIVLFLFLTVTDLEKRS
jgi:ABC-2 type transport system permease protein